MPEPISEKVPITEKMMDGINLLDTTLREDVDNPDILMFFPVWSSGAFFGNDFVIFKTSTPGMVVKSECKTDCIKKTFPDPISYISHNETTITYGVEGEIYITYEHTEIGVFKESVKIYDDKWREYEVELSSEKDMNDDDNYDLPKMTDGLVHTIEPDGDANKIENEDRLFKIHKPDMGVELEIDDNKIKFKIPDGVELPFEFDPTISFSALGWGHSNNCIMDDDQKLYLMWITTARVLYHAYSTDHGDTWTIEFVDNSVLWAHTSLCIDSDKKLWAVCSKVATATTYYLSKVNGGGWSGKTSIGGVDQPDCAIGPNKVLQITAFNSSGLDTRIWHYDIVNGFTQISGNFRSIHSGIFVDSSNTAHLLYGQGVSSTSNRNRQIYYRNLPYGGVASAPELIYTSGTNDSQINPFIVIDSTLKIHVMWANLVTVGHFGFYNQNYKNKPSGGAWGNYATITAVNGHNFGGGIGLDEEDTTHYTWKSRGYGSFPGQYHPAYRKRESDGTWIPALASAPTYLHDDNVAYADPGLINTGRGIIPSVGTGIYYIIVGTTELVWYLTPDIVWPSEGDAHPIVNSKNNFILNAGRILNARHILGGK